LIVSGLGDPIAPPEHAARLKNLLEAAGAEVLHRSVPAGSRTDAVRCDVRPRMAGGEIHFA
jgi:hypothetical protein